MRIRRFSCHPLPIELILHLLANGWTTETILENYPQLKKEYITAVLKYANDS